MKSSHALLLAALFIVPLRPEGVSAMVVGDSTSPERGGGTPRGLTTMFGSSFYGSSIAPASATDYEFFAGMGYNINAQLMVALKVLTGHEELDGAAMKPYSGRLDLGGGEFECTYRLLTAGEIRPSVSAAYGLSTVLLGSSGYHGQFVQMGVAGEYFVIDNISLQGGAWFRYRHFNHLITDGDFQQTSFEAIDRSVGVNIGCNIHFNIFP